MENEVFHADKFLYFSYSANMLTFRVKMFNPAAEFVSIGRVDVCTFIISFDIK